MDKFLKTLKPIGEVILFILSLPLILIVMLFVITTAPSGGGIRRPPKAMRPCRQERELNMKEKTKYCCEICKKEYDSERAALTDEAAHFGLTSGEYCVWTVLYQNVLNINNMGIDYSKLNTDERLRSAFEDLSKFEKEHNLKGRTPCGFSSAEVKSYK